MVYEMNQYKWKGRSPGVSAQAAGEYMETISQEEGGLTAAKLLDRSRAEDALLHRCFEWDNSKAAEKYRLRQANGLIRNIVVVTTSSEDKTPASIPMFVNISREEHSEVGVYVPTVHAMSREEQKENVLNNALRSLIQFKEKYKMLKELESVIRAIDAVIADNSLEESA